MTNKWNVNNKQKIILALCFISKRYLAYILRRRCGENVSDIIEKFDDNNARGDLS